MEGLNVQAQGHDVVEFKVQSGTVRMLVPADLPDSEVCQEHWFEHYMQWELEFDDGLIFSGWTLPACDAGCTQVSLNKSHNS